MIYNSSPAAIERAKETAEAYGVKVVAKKCDVGDYADIHRVFDEVTAEFGTYDILVANSGVQQNTPCLTMKPEEWAAIDRVNFSGVFFCAQKAAQDFKKFGKPGNIIVTASMSGVIVNVRPRRRPLRRAAPVAREADLPHRPPLAAFSSPTHRSPRTRAPTTPPRPAASISSSRSPSSLRRSTSASTPSRRATS